MLRFHKSPYNSVKRRKTRGLFKYAVRKAVRHNRMNKFIGAWHAPPRTVSSKYGFIKTGGGPGYRLARKRFGRNVGRGMVKRVFRKNPYTKFIKRGL